MARAARSPLAAVLVLAFAASCLLGGAFVPAPAAAAQRAPSALSTATPALLGAALAAQPMVAMALEDEDEEGFDGRIIAVLALPLAAISWALFNVWRVAFRQVVRIGESTNGSSKIGLRPED